MHQLFLITGRLLGRAPRSPIELYRGQYAIPLSKLFYCAECGDVFAKCPVVYEGNRTATWAAVFACCQRCTPKSGLHVPGSIWHHEAGFVAAFPDAVLQHEARVHLLYYKETM